MMKCDDARSLMNLAIDGEISADDLSKLNDHLEHCEKCTVEYEELRYLKELMGEIEMKELPREFERELHVRLLEEDFLNRQYTNPPKKKLSVLKPFKKHSNFIIAAAAVAIIVMLSNNPLHFINGNYMESKATASMSADESFETQSMDMAPQEAPMFKNSLAAGARGEADYGATESSMDAVEATTSLAATNTVPEATYRTERMIISSGSVSLNIVDYDAVVNQIKDTVKSWDGYVENENTSNRGVYEKDDLKYGNLTIRIPSDQFDAMMNLLKTYGKVVYDSTNAYDVTKEYRDTAQEVENLKLTEQRFREILSTATEVTDILSIENELTRLRGQINQYQRQLKDWEVLVDLSTISIELNEVTSLEPTIEPIDDTLLGRAKAELINTINHLRVALENLFIWVIANSPLIAIVGVVAVIVSWILKRKQK